MYFDGKLLMQIFFIINNVLCSEFDLLRLLTRLELYAKTVLDTLAKEFSSQ